MRRIQIFRLNPPSKGIFIRQRVGHPRIGYAWHEKRVYTKNGLLTSTETAAFLNLGLRRIYQLIEKEDLKPLRKGGQLLFSLRSLIQFEAKRRKPGRRKIREEAFLAG